MTSVNVDIQELLVGEGFGIEGGRKDWGIFTDIEPSEPINSITIYNLLGSETRSLDSTCPIESQSPFQVRVRGTKNKEVRPFIWRIRTFLPQHRRFDMGDTHYHAIVTTGGDPLMLPQDLENRFIWVQNFMAHRVQKVEEA